MKVFFSEKDRNKVLTSIKQAMGDRKLAEIVDFSLTPTNLQVVISKMGTSTLTFDETENDQGLEYTLTKEKIAFAHKAFKDDVTRKIINVVEQAGGEVSR